MPRQPVSTSAIRLGREQVVELVDTEALQAIELELTAQELTDPRPSLTAPGRARVTVRSHDRIRHSPRSRLPG
jgi:hypothetical protein